MHKRLLTGLGISLCCLSFSSVAADRGHAMEMNSRFVQLKHEINQPMPAGWETNINVGEPLGFDLYRHGTVLHRDDTSGIVSLEIAGKVVRINAGSRKIIDITG